MNQSISDAPSIQFNLPPLSLSLFDAEPSTHDQPNGVVHGSAPKHSSEPSSPTSSGYAAERGSSSTATSVSHVEDSISHEIEELNIHDPPSVSNDSDASWLPSQRNIDEVYICSLFAISLFSIRFHVLAYLFLSAIYVLLSTMCNDYILVENCVSVVIVSRSRQL
jgi:hypothetical protein